MKKIAVIIISAVILFSCGTENPHERLRKLEAQRDDLDKQISQLKLEIAGNNSTNSAKMMHVDIEQILPTMFKHYIKVQGTVESDNNILIPARASGVVKKIYVQSGDQVQKGKILAELDGVILENTLAELEINLEMARIMYERQKRLWDKKIGSEMQFLQSKTNKESLEKRLAATREQYLLTKVIAPINGTVDQILLKEGEAIGAGFGTIRIVQLSALKITASLSEEHIGQINVGDSVRVRFPVIGKELLSTICSVSMVIDPQNRTFPIEIGLPKGEKQLQPNMLAVLTINNYSNPDALTVPVNIVQKTGSSKFLFIVNRNNDSWQVERRTVQTGKTYGDVVEITDGLKAKEYIVKRGFQNLADQQMVLVAIEDFKSETGN